MNSRNRATQNRSCRRKKTEALSRPEFPEVMLRAEQGLGNRGLSQLSREEHPRQESGQGFAGAAAAGALLASFGVDK